MNETFATIFHRAANRHGGDITPALEHPDMQTFIRWLDGKPSDFYRRTR